VRDLGWGGFIAVSIFVASLASALVYLWRLGALDSAR
jgi:NADH-quinone oxidoreductase subunit A